MLPFGLYMPSTVYIGKSAWMLCSGVGTTGAPGAGAPLYFLLEAFILCYMFCSITWLARSKPETLGWPVHSRYSRTT